MSIYYTDAYLWEKPVEWEVLLCEHQRFCFYMKFQLNCKPEDPRCIFLGSLQVYYPLEVAWCVIVLDMWFHCSCLVVFACLPRCCVLFLLFFDTAITPRALVCQATHEARYLTCDEWIKVELSWKCHERVKTWERGFYQSCRKKGENHKSIGIFCNFWLVKGVSVAWWSGIWMEEENVEPIGNCS